MLLSGKKYAFHLFWQGYLRAQQLYQKLMLISTSQDPVIRHLLKNYSMKYSSVIIKIEYFSSLNAKASLALEEGTFLLFFYGIYQ